MLQQLKTERVDESISSSEREKLFFEDHQLHFSSGVFDYKGTRHFSDVDIMGNSPDARPVPVHSQVLALCSSVLSDALDEEIRRAHRKPLIVVPHFDHISVKRLVAFLYSGAVSANQEECATVADLLATLHIEPKNGLHLDVLGSDDVHCESTAELLLGPGEPTHSSVGSEFKSNDSVSANDVSHAAAAGDAGYDNDAAIADGWPSRTTADGDGLVGERDADLDCKPLALRTDEIKSERRHLRKSKKLSRRLSAGKKLPKTDGADSERLPSSVVAPPKKRRVLVDRLWHRNTDLASEQVEVDGDQAETLPGEKFRPRGLVTPYVCEICDRRFSSVNTLNDHLNGHKGVNPYRCDHCDAVFSHRRSYQRHIIDHKTGKLSTGDDVPRRKKRLASSSGSAKENHVSDGTKSSRRNKDIDSSVADEADPDGNAEKRGVSDATNFDQRNGDDGDESVANENDNSEQDSVLTAAGSSLFRLQSKFTCGICRKVFEDKREFTKHIKTHDGVEETVTCRICNKQLKKLCIYAHMKTHSGEKPHECSVCHKRFLRRRKLRDHMMTHTGEKPYTCDICHKAFNNSTTLRRHRVVHTGEKGFICAVCGASFTQNSSLQTHNRLHSLDNPFRCTVCFKSFTQSQTLRDHMNIHRGIKPYMCDQCSDTFTYKSSFDHHLRKHHGAVAATIKKRYTKREKKEPGTYVKKGFSCEICNKNFTDRSYLRRHARVHSGEKPFKCGECSKSFGDRSVLRKHKFTHSEEKPFSCTLCGKSFGQLDFLKRHYRIHTGEHPFRCNFCPKRLPSRRDLERHMKEHSGVIAQQGQQQPDAPMQDVQQQALQQLQQVDPTANQIELHPPVTMSIVPTIPSSHAVAAVI